MSTRELDVTEVAESVETQQRYGDTPNRIKCSIVTFVDGEAQLEAFLKRLEANDADLPWYEVIAFDLHDCIDRRFQQKTGQDVMVVKAPSWLSRPKLYNIARQYVGAVSEAIIYLEPNEYIDKDLLRERVKPFQSVKPFGIVGKLITVPADVRVAVYDSINERTAAPLEHIAACGDIENSENIRCVAGESISVKLDCFDRMGGFPIDVEHPFIDFCVRAQMIHFALLPQPE